MVRIIRMGRRTLKRGSKEKNLKKKTRSKIIKDKKGQKKPKNGLENHS